MDNGSFTETFLPFFVDLFVKSGVPLGILLIVVGYLLGNISPATLIGRLHGIDIKKVGSGNAGTTNVLRVLGKKAAVATLFIDMFKGVLAVLIGRLFGGEGLSMLCGSAALIGHIWPLIFRFKGGKGVATGIGILLTVKPLLGLIVAVCALLVMAVSKRVSLGSVVGAVICPIAAYFIDSRYALWALLMVLIILVKHIGNIKRLLKGEEPQFNLKK